jgi:enoyl-CoA hydratase/carnithine racemase
MHIHDSQNAISASVHVPQPVIAAVHCVAFILALDTLTMMLCAVDVHWATSGTSFSTKEVDVGLEANLGMLMQVPKLVRNALPQQISR